MAISTISSSGINQAADTVLCTTSGNVGIGTSSPNRKLEVNGDIQSTNSSSNYSNLFFGVYGTPADSYTYIRGDARSTGFMSYYTNATERMRIDTSGNLLVGTTSQIISAKVSVLCNASTNGVIVQQVNNANSVYNGVNAAGSNTFYVTGTGQIYSTSTSIAAISDQSQKENVVDISYGLDAINQLRPVKFDFKEGCASEEKGLLGFIAQEVETVIPELVKPFGDDGLLGLKMGDMLPVLVKAIQEQQALISSQAAVITQLTERIAALEAK